jgi:hypothetical protein
MTPSTWTIKPGEKKFYEADAEPGLSANDTITEVAVKLYDEDGADVTTGIIGDVDHTITSTYMKWFIDASALNDGENYWMKITTTTQKGEEIIEEVKIKVREKFTV